MYQDLTAKGVKIPSGFATTGGESIIGWKLDLLRIVASSLYNFSDSNQGVQLPTSLTSSKLIANVTDSIPGLR
jgi:hypothetical protein